MILPYRAQIEAIPGGSYIVQALHKIVDVMHAQPFRIGAAHIRSGKGSPETVIVGNVGDLYLRVDGGTSTTLYVKQSGTGNIGWVAK